MAILVSMGSIKTSPEIRRKIRVHVILRGEKLGEWLEKAIIEKYNNDTMSAPLGKGEKNEQQQEKNERIERN
jgi:hypothetical protein